MSTDDTPSEAQLAEPAPAATPARYGPRSGVCGGCGYFLPQPPHEPVCARCSAKGVKLEGFTRIETLYLAAQLWKLMRGNEPDQVFIQHALHSHYVGRNIDGGKYGYDAATPVTVLREQLTKDATAWRSAGCPI